MFQFVTENVLNDASRVSAVAGVLTIKRLNKFLATGVKACYKRAYAAPVKEVVTIAVPATPGAGTYRLALDIRLSGSQKADYTRWAVNKGKPLYVEYEATTADGATANSLATALANPLGGFIKGLKRAGFLDLTGIAVTGTAPAGNLVITALDEYQRFISARLEKYNATTGDYDLVAAASVAPPTTVGNEGFGTPWQITKNLRIPTQEATRFGGEHSDELPVAGAAYSQYTIVYEQDRNIGGMGVVGEKSTSQTTHVLYVASTAVAAFETALTTATITKTDITG